MLDKNRQYFPCVYSGKFALISVFIGEFASYIVFWVSGTVGAL
jgi:hypothetical protein